MKKAKFIVDVIAPCHGYISTMETRSIGFSVVGLGGGRTSNDQAIDHSVGFDHILPIGSHVSQGDILARAHGTTKESAELASRQYIKSLAFSDVPVAEQTVIYSI